MKAITVQQYWAWAIAAGHKHVENRTWNTSHRGPLAIQAGIRDWEGSREALEAFGLSVPSAVPRRAIVAVVDLVDVVLHRPGEQKLEGFTDEYGLDDDPMATGPYCWILRNVRPLPSPVRARGQPGLYELPFTVEELIRSETSRMKRRTILARGATTR